jgi:membrane protease YdiL (CAAX protease family)
MLVILPGIGEELIFRGLLQPVIGRLIKSNNLAVILTAAIFSAAHLDFNGFLPRFVIGLLLGFIFLWTGKLWLSIVLHSINNSLVLIASYAVGPGQSSGQEPGYILAGQIILMLIFLFPAIKMLKEFRMQYSPRRPDSVPGSIQTDLK